MTHYAAGYVRQSAARQNKSEASPATQRTENRARATQLGAEWVGSYEDIGISAYNGDVRPSFERLIADCHAGRVTMIIVYYISRLSRLDPLDAIPIVTDLLNRGVTIISVTEGEFRKGNLMDLIHLIMRLDAAHGESKNKSKAITGAKDAARAVGGFVGGKAPYGFTMVDAIRTNDEGRPIAIKLLERRPDEVEVIREVIAEVFDPKPEETPIGPRRTRRHPGSLGAISRALNERGVPTRGATTGKNTADSSWSPRTLGRILRDPRIAGYDATVLYTQRPDGRKSASIAGYRLVRDPETMEPVQAWPAIVETAEWWALQERLDGKIATPASPPKTSLLTALGILFCECTAPMKSHRDSMARFRSAYRCSRPAGRRRDGTHTGDCTVSQGALDDYVARRIFALIATADTEDPDTLDVLAEATRLFGLASAEPAVAAQRGALRTDLTDAEAALNALYDDRQAGGYSGDIGRRRFLSEEKALSGRIETLTTQIAAIDAAATPTLPIEEWLGEPGTDSLGPGSWWYAAPIAERRAMVQLFVRRITINKSPAGMTRPPIEARATIEWARQARPA